MPTKKRVEIYKNEIIDLCRKFCFQKFDKNEIVFIKNLLKENLINLGICEKELAIVSKRGKTK